MIIYHGSTGTGLEQPREYAPSHTHGYCWIPSKMTPKDDPYILDNGAYTSYINNEPWDATAFISRLNQIDSMPRDPDFVILPDVVTNPKKTIERSTQWAEIITYDTAFAVQDGIKPERAVEVCDRLDCTTIFVGGTVAWKRKNATEFVEMAHDHGFACHIGRPGDLLWANDIGVDSVDTTSICIDGSWHRLERLENTPGVQSTFNESLT